MTLLSGESITVTTEYEANSLNQYTNMHTDSDPPVGLFPTYDEDGNMTVVNVSGDMNCDGQTNSYDIDLFVALIGGG